MGPRHVATHRERILDRTALERETLFEVDIDVAAGIITVHVESNRTMFPLEDGKSLKTYYSEIIGTLQASGVRLELNPKTQEMRELRYLNRDETPLVYDADAAQKGVRLFQYAAREQAAFLAPLRCRKVKPALFWGTFDVSSIIVYGKPEPFPEDKLIEKAAFDEQMIEFGFWLGTSPSTCRCSSSCRIRSNTPSSPRTGFNQRMPIMMPI